VHKTQSTRPCRGNLPPFNRILESSLYVTSLDRSTEFYRRVFSLEVMLRDERMCALAVPGRQEWRAHLQVLNIGIESELVWPHGGSSLYFRDPDGHSVEVGTAGLWPQRSGRALVISD
jgi:catechol 2,3-dioxygenase-like lactoylglutathione lyase family enzyme